MYKRGHLCIQVTLIFILKAFTDFFISFLFFELNSLFLLCLSNPSRARGRLLEYRHVVRRGINKIISQNR